MKLTLKALQNAGACAEGKAAFAKTYGKKGAEARDVFTALAENDKRDWLIWIVNHFPGFLEAVGEINVNGFQISFSGQVEASEGMVVFSSGSATVEAYGSATVEAYDSATVRAYDSATVRAYDSATVRASGSATVMISEYYSNRVEITILSSKACAVDRRSGKPELILVQPEGEVSNV